MVRIKSLVAVGVALGLLTTAATAFAATPSSIGLGTAAPYAVLAGTPSITNTGPSVITGDLGIDPALAVTGFPPGLVIGTIHTGDAVALQAKNDLVTAYNDAAGRPVDEVLAGGALGGRTLVGGIYNAGGVTLDLTGSLTLDAQNDPSSVWIFQATSDLITASSSSVSFINGGSPCNVFWQVSSSATLGSGSTFVGTIMALTSITLNNDVTVLGRALARNGAVTLINDRISSPSCVIPLPTPTPTPTATPTAIPTPTPTTVPSASPTTIPSTTPSGIPTAAPSTSPSGPTAVPTATAAGPSAVPTETSSAPVIVATAIPTPTEDITHGVIQPPTPEVTLPPTDMAPDAAPRGIASTFGGAMVALGGLLVLAAVVIAQRRPARR